MSDKDAMVAGLEETPVVEETKKRTKRVQTPEEKEILIAGVEKLKELGVSENLAKVLAIVPEWNGDKEELAAAKEAMIESFGGSENLKDFIDGDFMEELKAYFGISKVTPVLNNIKSFYARRASNGSHRTATMQVSIGGTFYKVDKAYFESLADKSNEEKRELLLQHEKTTRIDNIPEIL